jgi:hypothetical protein
MSTPNEKRARASDRRTKWLCGFLALVLIAAAAGFAPLVHSARRTMQPDYAEATRGESAGLALVSSLFGSFKGIWIVTMWWRAMELQENEQYFELDLLYRNICKLEKHFPSVWAYAGWNASYNISVKHHTPEERWRWVNQGIEILRDDGLRYNPGAGQLYYELAWIYSHKIGKFSDDEHRYYKFRLAVSMERAMGEGYVEDLTPFIEAPRTLRELRQTNDSVNRLVTFLENNGYEPEDTTKALDQLLDETRFRAVMAYLGAERLQRDIPREGMTLDEFDAAARKHLNKFVRRDLMNLRRNWAADNPSATPTDTFRAAVDLLIGGVRRRLDELFGEAEVDALGELAGTGAGVDLMNFVRARYLRDELKMGGAVKRDLSLLQELRDRFGPLDWRLADAHALHWAYLATRRADVGEFDDNYFRIVLESLYQMMRAGRLHLNETTGNLVSAFITYPNTAFYDELKEYHLEVIGQETDEHRLENWKEDLRGLYEEGVIMLFLDGQVEKARREMAEAHERWPWHEGFAMDSVQEYVYTNYLEHTIMVDYQRAQAAISQIIRMQLEALALGNERRAAGMERLARLAIDRYMQEYSHHPIPPYDELLRTSVNQYVYGPQGVRMAPFFRERLMDRLGLPERRPEETPEEPAGEQG